MKNILFSVLLCFSICSAQEVKDIGKIALSVVVPDNIEMLNAAQKSNLETKITHIAAAQGLAASGYDQSFIIYPKFSLYSEDVVETGMQNLHKITAEVSLYIKQASTDVLFASTGIKITGTGKNRSEAVTNAISRIPVKDDELTKFVEAGKDKIIRYYESKCGDIIAKSDALIKRQQYEEALFDLLAVPEECSSCYEKVSFKAIEAFNAHKIKKCAEQLQIAKAKAAAKDYYGALEVLQNISPSIGCFIESQQLLISISDKIEDAQKEAWEFKMQQYADAKEREERNFQALNEQRKENNEYRKLQLQAAKETVLEVSRRLRNSKPIIVRY